MKKEMKEVLDICSKKSIELIKTAFQIYCEKLFEKKQKRNSRATNFLNEKFEKCFEPEMVRVEKDVYDLLYGKRKISVKSQIFPVDSTPIRLINIHSKSKNNYKEELRKNCDYIILIDQSITEKIDLSIKLKNYVLDVKDILDQEIKTKQDGIEVKYEMFKNKGKHGNAGPWVFERSFLDDYIRMLYEHEKEKENYLDIPIDMKINNHILDDNVDIELFFKKSTLDDLYSCSS